MSYKTLICTSCGEEKSRTDITSEFVDVQTSCEHCGCVRFREQFVYQS